MSEKFNPAKHLIQLKGKQYLETKYRIQWMRDEHPDWSIGTEVMSFEPVLVKATVSDENGRIIATGHAGAVDKGNAVWSGRAIEKSETAAIGRALAHAGYGTQFTGEDTDGIVDSPVERQQSRPNPLTQSSQQKQAPTPPPPADDLREIFPDDGSTPFIEVNKIHVVERKGDKPMLVMSNGDTKVTIFTRNPLRPLLSSGKLEELATIGTCDVPMLRVYYQFDGKFNKFVRVEKAAG